jgi:hypothetical protein
MNKARQKYWASFWRVFKLQQLIYVNDASAETSQQYQWLWYIWNKNDWDAFTWSEVAAQWREHHQSGPFWRPDHRMQGRALWALAMPHRHEWPWRRVDENRRDCRLLQVLTSPVSALTSRCRSHEAYRSKHKFLTLEHKHFEILSQMILLPTLVYSLDSERKERAKMVANPNRKRWEEVLEFTAWARGCNCSTEKSSNSSAKVQQSLHQKATAPPKPESTTTPLKIARATTFAYKFILTYV